MSNEPHHWLKLWVSAASDPHLDNLDVADFGRWCKLLLYVKVHGNMGTLDIPDPARNICNQLQIKTLQDLASLPNILLTRNAQTGVTKVTVEKWYKYQIDNSSERVKKHRAVTPNVTPNVTPQEKKRKEKKRYIYTDKFLTFFSSYPRKENKHEAFKAWDKIQFENGLFDEIMTSLEKHKKTTKWKTEPQFIPHPATWLNGKRWEDEIQSNSSEWKK